MKKLTLTVGLIFFVLGILISLVSSVNVLKFINKGALGAEVLYCAMSIIATIMLFIPAMIMLWNFFEKVDTSILSLSPSLIFFLGGVASLLYCMIVANQHMLDGASLSSFVIMMGMAIIQCFVAAICCLPKSCR